VEAIIPTRNIMITIEVITIKDHKDIHTDDKIFAKAILITRARDNTQEILLIMVVMSTNLRASISIWVVVEEVPVQESVESNETIGIEMTMVGKPTTETRESQTETGTIAKDTPPTAIKASPSLEAEVEAVMPGKMAKCELN